MSIGARAATDYFWLLLPFAVPCQLKTLFVGVTWDFQQGVAMGPCHQCGPTLSLARVGFNVSAMANTFDVSFQALFWNHKCQGEVIGAHCSNLCQKANSFQLIQLRKGRRFLKVGRSFHVTVADGYSKRLRVVGLWFSHLPWLWGERSFPERGEIFRCGCCQPTDLVWQPKTMQRETREFAWRIQWLAYEHLHCVGHYLLCMEAQL